MRLCEDAAIEDGEAKGFVVPNPNPNAKLGIRIFVVRWENELKGYLNSCPHIGMPLDWTPDKFFAADDRHLICATHGALFLPEDGMCVVGPCHGEALEKVEIAVEDGWIVYRGPAPAPAASPAA
jgi:nitrite reductase/ring-hydroxylating ferredoxin subunit